MNRFFKKVFSGDIRSDDMLEMMGLTRRRSALGTVLPALGLLVAGGAIGAGLGLVFAPSSGRRMRQNVEDRVGQLREKFKNSTSPQQELSNNH
jgi:hypothetical protein